MKEDNDPKCAFLVALNKVQGTLESVTKDSTNPHFKSKYASLTAVNQTVMGPLTEAGFVLLSGGTDIGGKPYLRTTLSHIKGHSESFDYPIVNDGNPQHTLASISYGRRGSICALLNLSVEDDDGETATGRQVVNHARTAPAVTQAVAQVFKPKAESTGEVLSFVPAAVSIKEGEGAKGRWKKYGILKPGEDKAWFSTFNEEIGESAIAAKAAGHPFAFTFKADGKFSTITGVVAVATEELESIPF